MLEHFANEVRQVSVTAYADGEYVDGEWVNGSAEGPVVCKMIEIPITPAQLRSLPEGRYTAEDKKLYHEPLSGPLFPAGTLFEFDSVQYEVRDITDRRLLGGFVIYYVKRKAKTNA